MRFPTAFTVNDYHEGYYIESLLNQMNLGSNSYPIKVKEIGCRYEEYYFIAYKRKLPTKKTINKLLEKHCAISYEELE